MSPYPHTFIDAVLLVMKQEGLAVKPAIARARTAYPRLCESDRAISNNFAENDWFVFITEARVLAAERRITLAAAMVQVFEANPLLVKQLLGRDKL